MTLRSSRVVVDDVKLDVYSATACGQAYSVAVTPVWAVKLVPPGVTLGFPRAINVTMSAEANVDDIRTMLAVAQK
jgi:hypothetical protein